MATQRVLYKGKKELTMAEYEAITSWDDAIDYDLTDYPNTVISTTQMAYALTCSRLFPEGATFICGDTAGDYLAGRTYKIKVTDGVKSWEDITPISDIATDDVTISMSTDGKLQAVGLTDGTDTYTLAQLIALLPRSIT